MAINDVPPVDLVAARRLAHHAVQWPSKAARANLPAQEDDSHSNLGWDAAHDALVSHPLDAAGQLRLGFSFARRSLIWLKGDEVADALPLQDADDPDAWVDACLHAAELASLSHASMPYALDDAFDRGAFDREAAAIATLGAWFGVAHVALTALADEHGARSVKPAAVRCWPHHFDIAVLFQLDAGDPETARSIGIGLSPGDGSYAEPYLYCSPWPAPDPSALWEIPPPFRWHTDGFVSMVATGTALLSADLAAVARAGFEAALDA